jgi:hypothetical protein
MLDVSRNGETEKVVNTKMHVSTSTVKTTPPTPEEDVFKGTKVKEEIVSSTTMTKTVRSKKRTKTNIDTLSFKRRSERGNGKGKEVFTIECA